MIPIIELGEAIMKSETKEKISNMDNLFIYNINAFSHWDFNF